MKSWWQEGLQRKLDRGCGSGSRTSLTRPRMDRDAARQIFVVLLPPRAMSDATRERTEAGTPPASRLAPGGASARQSRHAQRLPAAVD